MVGSVGGRRGEDAVAIARAFPHPCRVDVGAGVPELLRGVEHDAGEVRSNLSRSDDVVCPENLARMPQRGVLATRIARRVVRPRLRSLGVVLCQRVYHGVLLKTARL